MISSLFFRQRRCPMPALRLALFFLLFTGTCLHAQTFYFDRYGVEDGLNSSKVYSILQDSRDYIWLGTETGLSRFDGKLFENFSMENGLAAAGVYSLFQDSQNRLWFGHLNGGISLWENGQFKVVTLPGVSVSSDVTSFLEDANYLWISTQKDGLFRITLPYTGGTETQVRQYRGSSGLSDRIMDSYLDSKGTAFFITDAGIKTYNTEEDRFETHAVKGLTSYFSTICMYESSSNEYWYGTYNGGLYHYTPEKESMTIFDSVRDGLAKNWVSCITEDSRGNMWIGTWGGGISRISKDGKLQHFYDENGLDATHIQDIIEDREGNILIASQYNGLRIYKGDHFTTIQGEDILPDPNVYAINRDQKGDYYFGTNAGLVRYSPQKEAGRFKVYNRMSHSINNNIRFLRRDPSGKIWMGTDGGGVFTFDPEQEKFVYNAVLNANLGRDKRITGMEIDRDGNVWIGIAEALVFWNPKEEVGETFTQIHGLAGSSISTLYCDEEGYLWIGSKAPRGLTRMDMESKECTIIQMDRDYEPRAITSTPDGRIWVGGALGVSIIRDTVVYDHLSVNDGLLSNFINLLETDAEGELYIGTNNGINRYSPAGGQMMAYTEKTGFTGIETKSNAVFRDQEGVLWFGTANGVTRFDKSKLRELDIDPLTHIRSMQVGYVPRTMEEGMRLSYKERSVVFDYYSICLSNPDAVRFQVMLEGADEDWRPVTTQTRAIYSALPHGKYTFYLKARNHLGKWNSEPVSYSFTIKPPFYLSWWFIIGMVLLTVALVFLYIQYREMRLKRENRILEEKVEERTAEVVQKSKVIEEKNRDITSSIRYAQRIQNALLPPVNAIRDMFVLFKPKDIVSGDFYWIHMTEDKLFVTAVDCTGHGVPGAFMSIIGHNSLNKIVKEYGITQPAEILDQLNVEVIKSLSQQSEEEIKDGMDLALLAIDKKKRMVEYAGAYNPLYHVSGDQMEVIKADRFPIGMNTSSQGRRFTNHQLQVKEGDLLYIFSDGYADQFGGDENKKYKSGNMRKLLMSIREKTMNEQRELLDREIESWMGERTQIDDILVIGIRM